LSFGAGYHCVCKLVYFKDIVKRIGENLAVFGAILTLGGIESRDFGKAAENAAYDDKIGIAETSEVGREFSGN